MVLTIFTTDDCRKCKAVEKILKKEGYDLNVIPADLSPETERILNDANAKDFPAVFKGMEYLGSGIMALHKVDPDINIAKYMQE